MTYKKGHTVSAETRAKMSANNGMKRPEVAARIGAANRGRTLSAEHRAKMSAARLGVPRPDLAGVRHGQWKGEEASYNTVHDRVNYVRGRASEHACVDCGGPARDWSLSHGEPIKIQEGGRNDGPTH